MPMDSLYPRRGPYYSSVMGRLAVVFLLFLLPLQAGAAVYRWTDENGKVNYSDTPRPGAEEVKILAPPDVPRPEAKGLGEGPAKPSRPEQAAQPYTRLDILKPTNAEVIYSSAGTVAVSLILTPALQTGHGIRVVLDGVAEPALRTAVQFSLGDIVRGPHSLQVSVVDKGGSALISSSSVSFQMWRGSALYPERQPSSGPLPVPQYPPQQGSPYPPLPTTPYPPLHFPQQQPR